MKRVLVVLQFQACEVPERCLHFYNDRGEIHWSLLSIQPQRASQIERNALKRTLSAFSSVVLPPHRIVVVYELSL